MPRRDIGQRISARDEEQIRACVFTIKDPVKVSEGVDRVRGSRAIDVYAADLESRITCGGKHRHYVTIFGTGHPISRFLPWLSSWDEYHHVEFEPVSDLRGSHEVTVMNGIKCPTK